MSANPLDSLYAPLYGSIYFGTLLTTALYGVTCMQTCFYYVRYQNDPLRTKALVALTWVLNTVHETLTVSGAYKHIIAGLVNPSSALDGDTELILEILPTTLVAILTQGFLAYRIYVFSGKKIFAPLIWFILTVLQLVSVPIYLAKSLYNANGVQAVGINMLAKNPLLTLSNFSLSLTAGEDILIAICMTFLLIRERTATDFASTLHILQRLTVLSVNTGIWTAMFALLSLIFMNVLALPLNMYNSVFFIPLCPLYCNTLLANLNARAYVGNESAEHISSSSMPVAHPTKSGIHRDSGLRTADIVFAPHEGVGVSRKEMVTFVDAD